MARRHAITDLGESVILHSEDSELALPRYGVWEDSGRGGAKVIEVSEDLEFLLVKYGLSADQLVQIGRGREGAR